MGNKKKIGCVIIMHPGQNNYGSSLQGFATVNKIEQLGYDYEIIRYNKKRSIMDFLRYMPSMLKVGLIGQIIYRLHKKIDLLIYREYKRTKAVRTRAVDAFKAKYLDSKSCFYTGYAALCQGSLNYSVVMVGSDQVWGPFSLYSKFYNLLFVDDSIPKFSYASSFGVSHIAPCQREAVANYLRRINKLGVREQRGKEIVRELTGRDDAQVVLDPTFLLTREEWESYIDESRCKVNESYILCYVLGEREDIRKVIKELGRRLNLKIVNLPHIDNYHKIDDKLGDINLYDVNPFDFIRLVRDAEYVVTDSFHGFVFSVLFHKKFVTFYRKDPKKKGSTHSRIDSLFNIFLIKDRIYENDICVQMQKDIDYEYVDRKLGEMRKSSLAFLSECLALGGNVVSHKS